MGKGLWSAAAPWEEVVQCSGGEGRCANQPRIASIIEPNPFATRRVHYQLGSKGVRGGARAVSAGPRPKRLTKATPPKPRS